eukprot:CAMPEP_0172535024 /NCGR_PEP_ID=MMETSP1067-20121228/7203_1 /TAXON_ID=265564 ORGANISM="Thalassiosira punctigera, Strain Tpunct2005C2" /NCGR_SAMPLE_ID=MMETSP1067 /ASSEMBLY_ACC=CAM_ASM_000444 /LENGTH=119 /DNA_ID=CAMNT_0013319913 /DNA_START=298 /DNA_END=657 /DNA_ORIENTATION=-
MTASDGGFGMELGMQMQSKNSEDFARVNVGSMTSLTTTKQESAASDEIFGMDFSMEMMPMYSIDLAFLNSKSDKESKSLVGLGEISSKPNQNGEHWFELEHTVESKSKTGKVGKPKYYQ